MTIHFKKYQGAGNDFIILDNRDGQYGNLTQKQILILCNRHFGVGADGLMMLNNHDEAAFEMKYFNADGKAGSMCGNGGRCIVAFAHTMGLVKDRVSFMAYDGLHEAVLVKNDWVELKMSDVNR
ncbi:MAG: diaminopimelate epimerase, partial [Chitinophagaceae bacterium]